MAALKPKWITQVSQFAESMPAAFVKQHQYFIDNVTRMLSNNLTFNDNMLSAIIQTMTFRHGIEQIVDNPLRQEIRPLGALGFNPDGLAVDSVSIRNIGNDLKRLGVTVCYKQPYGYIELLLDVAQSIPNGVLTSINYDQQVYVLGGLSHSLTVNPSRVTCLYDGIIEVNPMIEFAANTVGRRGVRIVNSDGRTYGKFQTSASPTASTNHTPSAFFRVLAGQYFETFVIQESGGALNLSGTGSNQTKMQARYVSPLPTYQAQPKIIILGG